VVHFGLVFNFSEGICQGASNLGLNMEYYSIPEAAKYVGVNVKTLRKHVKMGLVEAAETPLGWRLTKGALDAYRPYKDRAAEPVEGSKAVEPEAARQDSRSGVPLEAHLAALEFAERRLAEERARFAESQQYLGEVQLRAEQAERSRLALEWQLQKYQGVLAESAESLAQERALRLQAEAKLEIQELPLVGEGLVVGTSVPKRKGWGQRFRGWLLGTKTG